MKKLTITLPLVLLLASCASPKPQFRDMSTAELMSYNSTAAYGDQVQCREEVRIGSHIRRRNCATLRDQIQGRIGTLDTPSSSQSLTGSYLREQLR